MFLLCPEKSILALRLWKKQFSGFLSEENKKKIWRKKPSSPTPIFLYCITWRHIFDVTSASGVLTVITTIFYSRLTMFLQTFEQFTRIWQQPVCFISTFQSLQNWTFSLSFLEFVNVKLPDRYHISKRKTLRLFNMYILSLQTVVWNT